MNPDQEALRGLPAHDSPRAWQVAHVEGPGAIRSFPEGSAGGPDGFKPGHLLDLVVFRDASGSLVDACSS